MYFLKVGKSTTQQQEKELLISKVVILRFQTPFPNESRKQYYLHMLCLEKTKTDMKNYIKFKEGKKLYFYVSYVSTNVLIN